MKLTFSKKHAAYRKVASRLKQELGRGMILEGSVCRVSAGAGHWHLTRKAQIDYSLATRTMAFDIHALTWSNEIFEAAGIDASLMSEPVPTGSSAGTITLAAAQRTGAGPAQRRTGDRHSAS